MNELSTTSGSTRLAGPVAATDGLRALGDGDLVDRVLLVRDLRRCRTRRDTDYLRFVAADRSGLLPAIMWEAPEGLGTEPIRHVVGRVADHPRYGRQIVVSRLSAVDSDQVDTTALLPGPREDRGELERRLGAMIENVADTELRTLLDELLGPQGALRTRFVRAPAAKYNHHAYPGGLLEHSLQVAEMVAAGASVHDGVDRDLAVAGALLHDIGKLDAYRDDPLASDLNTAGRLEAEIPLGYFLVRTEIERIGGVGSERGQALLHIILSHHGRLEHGSPVVPCTREALLVHAMDNLSGQMGAFERLERETDLGEIWSTYDGVLGTGAFLGDRASPG